MERDAVLMGAKVCPRCAAVHPLADFKRRSRKEGQRESWCRDCVNAAARARRAAQRQAAVTGLGRRIRAGTTGETVRAVVAASVQRLGGVNAVARELAQAYQSARSSRDRLSILRLILRLDQAAG
jgi:hypothetical protein